MSTRCYICIENRDKTINGIYCHSDGYLSYVGFHLYTFYNTEEKVRNLIKLGGLSSIGARIGSKVNFEERFRNMDLYNKTRNQCISYARDRNEELRIDTFRNKEELFKEELFGIEYYYIFSNNEWFVRECGSNTRLLRLEKRLRANNDMKKKHYLDHYLMPENSLFLNERNQIKVAYEKLFGQGSSYLKNRVDVTFFDFVIVKAKSKDSYAVYDVKNNQENFLSERELKLLKMNGKKLYNCINNHVL